MSRRAERFLRFAINRIMAELEQDILPRKKNISQQLKKSPASQMLFSLFGIASTQSCRCPQGHVTTKQNSSFVLDLNWPSTPTSFTEIIQRSLCGESKNTSWCEVCHHDGESVNDRSVASLPQYIMMVIGQTSAVTNQVREILESKD